MGYKYTSAGDQTFPFELAPAFLEAGYNICIETGTYKAATAIRLAQVFPKVYSIEASKELYDNAERRFSKRHKITFLHGKSSETLPIILNDIKKLENCKVVFYLDAHYSGGKTFYSPPPY